MFYELNFSIKVVETVFIFLLFDLALHLHQITSSKIIVESSILPAIYFPFLQLHVAGFQTCFSQLHDVFSTHSKIYRCSGIDLNYIFFHQIYIYIHLIYMFR